MSGLIEACKHPNNNIVCIHIYIHTPTPVYETCSPVLKAKNTVLEEVCLKVFVCGFSDCSCTLCTLFWFRRIITHAYTMENIPLNKIIFIFQAQGALLSKGEFLSLAESLRAAFTGFFLEKRNSWPCTDESPSTQQWDKQQHTLTGYTQHRHLGTELLHGCTRQAARRIPREDPGLYIVSWSDTERSWTFIG